MISVLIDHNIGGHAEMLWKTLISEGWLEVLSIKFFTFKNVGLPANANDREVWHFTQANRMFLLTDNRNMKGKNSLERTLREENTPTSLPVLTIGDSDRMSERIYREQCAERLVEIGLYLENYLGTARVFIP